MRAADWTVYYSAMVERMNSSLRGIFDVGTGLARAAPKCTIASSPREEATSLGKTPTLIAIILLLTSVGLAGQEIKPPSLTPAPQTDKHRDLLRDAVRL